MIDNCAESVHRNWAGERQSLSPKSPICKHLNPRNRENRPETCCFRAPIPGYLRPALVNCLGNSTYQLHLCVRSKLKCPLFVASEMSGFKVVSSPSGSGWFWGWGCRGRGQSLFPCLVV